MWTADGVCVCTAGGLELSRHIARRGIGAARHSFVTDHRFPFSLTNGQSRTTSAELTALRNELTTLRRQIDSTNKMVVDAVNTNTARVTDLDARVHNLTAGVQAAFRSKEVIINNLAAAAGLQH